MWISSIKTHMSILSAQKLWVWLTQALLTEVGKGCVLLRDKWQLVQTPSYWRMTLLFFFFYKALFSVVFVVRKHSDWDVLGQVWRFLALNMECYYCSWAEQEWVFKKIIQQILILIYFGDCLCELILRCVSDWFPVLYAHVQQLCWLSQYNTEVALPSIVRQERLQGSVCL